jgi:hypothetical protein
VNVLLLFLLLNSATGFRIRSGIVAALFAVHPMNVECVAWVAQRKSLLSTTFLLLALFAYGRYARKPGFVRYSLVALLLRSVSLPNQWSSPFRSFYYSSTIGRSTPPRFKTRGPRRVLPQLWSAGSRKASLFLFVFASAWVTVYAQHKSGAVATSSGLPLRFRLPNAVYSYLLYIFKGIWPVKLAVFYPNPEGPLPLWKPILASLFLIGVTVLVWRYRDKRYLLTGWLWYLGTLVPVIGIIQVGRQALADRYVYLPFIGLFVKIVWGTAELVPIPARRRILVPVTAITLTAFAHAHLVADHFLGKQHHTVHARASGH